MNDEDAGIIPKRKHGFDKGTHRWKQEGDAPLWQSLLGDFAQELIEEAHHDIEAFRRGEIK